MRLSQLGVVILFLSACGSPGVERVEINGMNCRVNTRKMGGEACCKTPNRWRRLDASGTRSPYVTTSNTACDPSDP